jgi:hypothetical protein
MVVTGHVVPHNTATAVRGPKYVVNTGKTPVLDTVEPQSGPGGWHDCNCRTRSIERDKRSSNKATK